MPVIVIDIKLGLILWEGSTFPASLRQQPDNIGYEYPNSDTDIPEEEADLRRDAGT